MARLNEVHLYGIVKDVKFAKNDDGDIRSARFSCLCRRRVSASPGVVEVPKTDSCLVFTKNKEIIEVIKTLKKNMAVEVFGQLITRRVDSYIACENCGKEMLVKTYIGYIHPTGINTSVDSLIPEQRAVFLNETKEKGNAISLMGEVLSSPFPLNDQKKKKTEDGTIYFEPVDSEELVFSMAIPRAYPIEEDLENRFDYPLVLSKTLAEEENYLFKGAKIFVRGAICKRDVLRKIPCMNCGNKNAFKDELTLVFPYTSEFMFTNKQEYALGSAVEALKESSIIIEDGEEAFEMDDIKKLLKPEYKNLRKRLFPKTIEKISAKKRGQVKVLLKGDA